MWTNWYGVDEHYDVLTFGMGEYIIGWMRTKAELLRMVNVYDGFYRVSKSCLHLAQRIESILCTNTNKRLYNMNGGDKNPDRFTMGSFQLLLLLR